MRAIFNRLNLREKGLLTVILLVVSMYVFFSVSSAMNTFVTQHRIVDAELEAQAIVISEEARINEQMREVLGELDSEKTYSSDQLLEKVVQMADEAELEVPLTRPITQQADVFDEHVLTINLRRIPMESLIEFENRIRLEIPYIRIDYMLIQPEPSDATLLRGEIRLSSFELNR